MSTTLAVYDLDREKIDLIKQTVAKGATDLELDLFLHACKRTGLDPLMKQIYAIKRWNAKAGKEEMAIQTGIDGYRLIADRTGQYAGSDEATYMVGEEGYPDVASVTVYKLVGGIRCPFGSSARWKEYCQTNKQGEPTSMWVKMPFLMLAKCAEALALRKAFPAELSGVYTHEEMMQADTAPESIGKTFAQKFPDQAKKIEDKLRQGDGADGPTPGVSPARVSDAPASLLPGLNTSAYLLQFPKELKGQPICDVTQVQLTWLSKYYNEKLAAPANAQSAYRQEWEGILKEVWAEQLRRDALDTVGPKE